MTAVVLCSPHDECRWGMRNKSTSRAPTGTCPTMGYVPIALHQRLWEIPNEHSPDGSTARGGVW
jgi:hypothetical protein